MADRRTDKEMTGMNMGTTAQGQAAAGARRVPPLVALCLALGALCAALLLMSGSSAQAYEGINTWKMHPTTSQAGGHPDVQMQMKWDNSLFKEGIPSPPDTECNCDDARVLTQHFPTGFIGNPHAVPSCELVEFSFGRCPASTQVGTIEPLFEGAYSPLYSITPHPEEAGLTGFWVPLVAAPVFISLNARTESDYGLDAESAPIYHPLPINTLAVTLWGVPAEKRHDFNRFIPPLKGFAICGGIFLEEIVCPGVVGATANIPPVPYLQNPTDCGHELAGILEIEYYSHNHIFGEDPWPEITGCEQLTFNPSLDAKPTTEQADQPSGIDVDLKVPQELSATTPSSSEIKEVTTTLPAGVSINPNAADGKVSCADANTGIGTRGPATCPEFSKVGTLSLDSSALPAPLPGAIYLGDPKPGERFRLVLAADGFGTHIKLLGKVTPDPQTGQLVIAFEDLPQSPLTEFNMHFFGSERGLLATPTRCGAYDVNSEFIPWDHFLPPQNSLGHFEVTSGPGGSACPGSARPFSPSLRAGSSNTTAAKYSPYTFRLTRNDGDQYLNTLGVTSPPGLLASIKGIPYCPDAALNEISAPGHSGQSEQSLPKCPAASRIGTSSTGVGAGTHPLYLPGNVYLAGPYKGAPLSLAVVTPAVSGPYDLGNVVVRAKIEVDRTTARIDTTSDPLPQIVEGVPLRIRSVAVNLDRNDFTLNPTNCDPFVTATTITGAEGATMHPAAPYQIANCASLPFTPKLSLKLSGGTARRGHPALQAVVQSQPGNANVSRTVVALPKIEQLDNAHIGSPCTRVQYAANQCPESSVIGTAMAETPLLGKPLEGKVYLRSSSHDLPDMVVALEGQFDIELVGRIDTKKGAMRTTFEGVPDAPFTKFVLNLMGGKKGLLINTVNACRSKLKAQVKMMGQNGAVSNSAVKPSCASKKARHKRHSKRKAVR